MKYAQERNHVPALLDELGISLVISGSIGAEAAVVTSSEYPPLADGNSITYNVDGTPS